MAIRLSSLSTLQTIPIGGPAGRPGTNGRDGLDGRNGADGQAGTNGLITSVAGVSKPSITVNDLTNNGVLSNTGGDASATTVLTTGLRSNVAAPYVMGSAERAADGTWSIHNWIDPTKRTDIRNGVSTWDATAALRSAIGSGEDLYLGYGLFNVSDTLGQMAQGQWIAAPGDDGTRINLPQGFNTSAPYLLQPNHFCSIAAEGGLSVRCYQPSTTSRASLTAYPPIIKAPSQCYELRLGNISIYRATVGLDLRGNVYGHYHRLLLQCFGVGMEVDGALEFWEAEVIQGSTLGLAGDPNLIAIYYDGQGTLLDLGRTDGFSIGQLKSFSQPIFCQDHGNGVPTGTIGVLSLDTNYATLNALAGKISIGAAYSSKVGGTKDGVAGSPAWPAASAQHIICSGAEVSFGSIQAFSNGPPGAPGISVTAGSLAIGAGTIRQFDPSSPAVAVSGGVCALGSALTLAGSNGGTQSRSVPFAVQANSGALSMKANITQVTGSTGIAASFSSDVAGNFFDPNFYPGLTYTLPSSQTAGVYRQVIQGGQITLSSADQVVAFPYAFATLPPIVTATIQGNPSYSISVSVDLVSKTSFAARIRGNNAGANTAPTGITVNWLAAGN